MNFIKYSTFVARYHKIPRQMQMNERAMKENAIAKKLILYKDNELK